MTGRPATDCGMVIEAWWPRLPPETRQWLMANNGDAVPPQVVAVIAAAGGPAATDGWWASLDGSPERCMPDDAVDWIEAAANDEVKGA